MNKGLKYPEDFINKVIQGDSLEVLRSFPDESIDCVITSPPYWGLRDYGVEGQIGLEKTPEEYVAKMVELFKEVKRVLKKEGTLWLNLGDSYVSAKSRYSSVEQTIAGHSRNEPMNGNRPDLKGHNFLKDKDLCGIPWMVAFALRVDGWYLRQDIIWHKPNPMPESVTDRCTKSHEYVFLMSKNPKYYFDNEAIKEPSSDNRDWSKSGGNIVGKGKHKKGDGYVELGEKYKYKKEYGGGGTSFAGHLGNFKANGEPINPYQNRNKRSVWTITTKPFKEAHFATFPEDLIVPMVSAGCPKEGIVLDPFMGAGTTALVSKKLGRNYVGIELNPEYIKIAEKRLRQDLLL